MNFRYPPYLDLLQCAENYPRAVFTLMMLWREVDASKTITYLRYQMKSECKVSWTKFRNDLISLTRAGLVVVDEEYENPGDLIPSIIHVSLDEKQINAAGKTLC